MKFLYSAVAAVAVTQVAGFAFAPSITNTACKTFAPKSSIVNNMVATNNNDVATDVESMVEQSPRSRKKTKEERLMAASKGLQVHVVGLSIHHASVEVREKLAIAESEWNAASSEICSTGQVEEAAVLSTCNRFEVYYAASDPREAMARVTTYLSERSGLPVSILRKNLFMLSGDDAVWHAMRVSGGLDSLIVGEGQILSQFKQCHFHAAVEEDGCGGKVLSRLLNQAVAAGKRVRSETAIAKGSVSISSAAVELSDMLCDEDLNLPFGEARLAVIGAGKMTRLLITHLASKGLKQITIVNRSMERPTELAAQFPDIEIEVKLMEDLWDVVGRSDIVYTATSAAVIIDEAGLQENGLAGGRPLMLVDIAVPRNVGDDAGNVPSVSAYNVDDLKAVVAKNTAMRQREMIEAENLLKEECAEFVGWRESLSAIPTINQLQTKANAFREEELEKCTRKLSKSLTDKELEAVERLSRGIVNKLLHGPMAHLRKTDSVEGKQAALKELSSMFRLEEEKKGRGRRKR